MSMIAVVLLILLFLVVHISCIWKLDYHRCGIYFEEKKPVDWDSAYNLSRSKNYRKSSGIFVFAVDFISICHRKQLFGIQYAIPIP